MGARESFLGGDWWDSRQSSAATLLHIEEICIRCFFDVRAAIEVGDKFGRGKDSNVRGYLNFCKLKICLCKVSRNPC